MLSRAQQAAEKAIKAVMIRRDASSCHSFTTLLVFYQCLKRQERKSQRWFARPRS